MIYSSCDNPYLEAVAKHCRKWRMTTFSEQAEFWTLGHHWHEHRQLRELGFKFGPRSYHNVDWGHLPDTHLLDDCKESKCKCKADTPFWSSAWHNSCITHSKTEFMSIHKLWKKPACISYDSTSVIIESNMYVFAELVQLTKKALERTNKVTLHANLMMGYGPSSAWPNTDPDQVIQQILHNLRETHLRSGNSIDIANMNGSELIMESTLREKSQTRMLHFHALISRKR